MVGVMVGRGVFVGRGVAVAVAGALVALGATVALGSALAGAAVGATVETAGCVASGVSRKRLSIQNLVRIAHFEAYKQ
jgi:hypothetical protein